MVAEKQEHSAREWFRGLVAAVIDDQTSYKQPEVAKEALDLARKNKSRYQELMTEWAYSAAYAEVCAYTRQSRPRSNIRVVGDAAFTPEDAEESFKKVSRFWTWAEHAGDRHIELPEMTREDLLIAANEREARGKDELFKAAFLRRIADGLEGGQIVSERYSEAEIEAIYMAVKEA